MIQELHEKADCAFFTLDPYIKFLPLVFRPPELNWTVARKCATESEKLIIIPVFGRDAIARRGFLEFAVVAIYSLLCCSRIDDYQIKLLISDYYQDIPGLEYTDLFDGSVIASLDVLKQLNVQISVTDKKLTTSKLYDYCDSKFKTIVRLDADCGVKKSLGSVDFFNYSQSFGQSGLNFIHTKRNSFNQLFHKNEGRMIKWDHSYQLDSKEFLYRVCRYVNSSLPVRIDPATLEYRMKELDWPSEGLSYMDSRFIKSFCILRDILQEEKVTPEWDEEILKVILACSLNEQIEKSKIRIIEYWEEWETRTDIVMNFRNIHSIKPVFNEIISGGTEVRSGHLDYIRRFIDEI